MKVLFIIPARGGSKGIPRKNIRNLNGMPLISYSIENALKVNCDKDVYVSSEDDEILTIAQKFEAKTHKRNDELSKDETTLDEVIFNAYIEISKQEKTVYDLIVTLQPTSPLLKNESISSAVQLMIEKKSIDTLISAVEDTHLTWRKENGKYLPNYTERVNRQYLKPTYKETGGFLITRNNVISKKGRIGKRVELFELEKTESIDIDNFEDWSICEYYLQRKRIVFIVSAYSEIGLGHIYNTLIIANEILNHEVIFFCDSKSQLGAEKIKQYNYPVFIQKSDNLQKEVLKLKPDLIVNDRLDTNKKDIDLFLKNKLPLIHFEDLGEGAKKASLVFNAIYPEERKIKNHFFGPDFFCAREEFILSPTKEIDLEVKDVLLAFGGVDPNNLSLKVLESIYSYCISKQINIKVITGFGYQNAETLKKYDKVQVFTNVKNISTHMLKADIAFTSAGRTTYELAILGIPSIVLAQNKREMTHFFASEKYGFMNLGIGVNVEKKKILEVFKKIEDFDLRKKMQKKMKSHDLRSGKKKVVSKIKNFIHQL
mgnify:CR=1 FL=1